jgi:hypothetical protein
MSARVKNKLGGLNVWIEDNPPYPDHSVVIDELGLKDRLWKAIGYRSVAAVEHDVECLSAVMRLRAGKRHNDLEDVAAVFITTNVELARQSKKFFVDTEDYAGVVPPCLTDWAVGNTMWLKNPTAAPSIPKARVLADALAALRPTDILWKKYLTAIARLEESGKITKEDYYALRLSSSARKGLMEITRGDVSAFSEGTALQVLEIAKRSMRKDLEDKMGVETARAAQAEARVGSVHSVAREKSKRVARKCRRAGEGVGAVCGWIVMAGGLGVLVVGSVMTWPGQVAGSGGAGWGRYVVPSVFGVLSIMGIGNAVWGTTVRELARKLECKVARQVRIRLSVWLKR